MSDIWILTLVRTFRLKLSQITVKDPFDITKGYQHNIFKDKQTQTKTIPLQKYLFRMHLSAHSKCLLCNNGEDEDLAHFLLNCPVLYSVRDEYFNIVSKQSSNYYIGVDFMEQSPSAKLQFIVDDIGIFYDFIGKMYIETCFRLRSEVLSVTV